MTTTSEVRNVCVRIYPNGEVKYSVRDEEGTKSWLEYNSVYRFGNTLFINRVYQEKTGYVRPGQKNFELFQEFVNSFEPEDSVERFIRGDNEEGFPYYHDDIHGPLIEVIYE
jgi:hypothetical protein